MSKKMFILLVLALLSTGCVRIASTPRATKQSTTVKLTATPTQQPKVPTVTATSKLSVTLTQALKDDLQKIADIFHGPFECQMFIGEGDIFLESFKRNDFWEIGNSKTLVCYSAETNTSILLQKDVTGLENIHEFTGKYQTSASLNINSRVAHFYVSLNPLSIGEIK